MQRRKIRPNEFETWNVANRDLPRDQFREEVNVADKGQVSRTGFLIHGNAGGQLAEIIPAISVIWPLQTASSPAYNGRTVFSYVVTYKMLNRHWQIAYRADEASRTNVGKMGGVSELA